MSESQRGKPAHNRIEPPEDVTIAYSAGESVLSLAKRLGVSNRVVDRWLQEAGVEPRNPKQAGLLRVVLTDVERTENQRAATRNYRAKRRGADLPDHLEHGSPAAIAIYSCPCVVCRDAKRNYDQQRRELKGDQLREQKRRRRAGNPELVRAQQRAYYRRNAEKIKSQVRAYQKTEKGRLVKRATDDRRRGVPLTSAALEYVALILHDPCVYCGGTGGTIEHIHPVASGGDGDWSNLAGACATCNSRKRHMPLLQFLLRLSVDADNGVAAARIVS